MEEAGVVFDQGSEEAVPAPGMDRRRGDQVAELIVSLREDFDEAYAKIMQVRQIVSDAVDQLSAGFGTLMTEHEAL